MESTPTHLGTPKPLRDPSSTSPGQEPCSMRGACGTWGGAALNPSCRGSNAQLPPPPLIGTPHRGVRRRRSPQLSARPSLPVCPQTGKEEALRPAAGCSADHQGPHPRRLPPSPRRAPATHPSTHPETRGARHRSSPPPAPASPPPQTPRPRPPRLRPGTPFPSPHLPPPTASSRHPSPPHRTSRPAHAGSPSAPTFSRPRPGSRSGGRDPAPGAAAAAGRARVPPAPARPAPGAHELRSGPARLSGLGGQPGGGAGAAGGTRAVLAPALPPGPGSPRPPRRPGSAHLLPRRRRRRREDVAVAAAASPLRPAPALQPPERRAAAPGALCRREAASARPNPNSAALQGPLPPPRRPGLPFPGQPGARPGPGSPFPGEGPRARPRARHLLRGARPDRRAAQRLLPRLPRRRGRSHPRADRCSSCSSGCLARPRNSKAGSTWASRAHPSLSRGQDSALPGIPKCAINTYGGSNRVDR